MPRKMETKPVAPASEDCPAPSAGGADEAQARPGDAAERWVLNGDVAVSRSFDVTPPRREK